MLGKLIRGLRSGSLNWQLSRPAVVSRQKQIWGLKCCFGYLFSDEGMCGNFMMPSLSQVEVGGGCAGMVNNVFRQNHNRFDGARSEWCAK